MSIRPATFSRSFRARKTSSCRGTLRSFRSSSAIPRSSPSASSPTQPHTRTGRHARSVPTIEIGGHRSINRLDPLLAGSTAIAFFRDVPNAGAQAHLSGRTWVADEVTVDHGRAARPLRAAPTSIVTIRWSVPTDLPAHSASSCGSAPAAHANTDPPAITIERCGSIAEANDAWRGKGRCTTVRNIALDRSAASRETAVQGLEPGAYQLRLTDRDLPPAFATLDFDATDSTIDLDLRHDRFFGRVTREGKPYHAFVAIGAGAVSDPDTAEYVAFSTPLPKSDPSAERRFFKDPNPIAIRECDSAKEIQFVPDAAPIPNSRFDIDLTPATIHVSVVDAGSGA